MTEGGCFCGAIRYRIEADPVASGYCHCTICQRSTGAPVLAWASFPVESFSYTRGRATTFHSSSWGHRQFCTTCGTQICYRDTVDANSVEVNVASLDSPASFPPDHHIFTKDRIAWFDTTDEFPRYEGSEPDA